MEGDVERGEEGGSRPRAEGGQQWSGREEMKYYLFVLSRLGHFRSGSQRQTQFFREMSVFM